MTDFVAYSSRWHLALLVLAAAVFVGIGLWMIGVFGPPPSSHRHPAILVAVIGWTGTIFFGVCGVLAVKKLLLAGEQLRVGQSGIRWTPWSNLTIPWDDISDVTVWAFAGQEMIVLHLRNPGRFPAKGPLAVFAGPNRKLTGGDIAISLTGTDRRFPEALAAIAKFWMRGGGPATCSVH